jgi:hypothetical protein
MDDLNKRVFRDDKISDEFIKKQKSLGRLLYTFNDDITDLENFGLVKHHFEFFPQTVYFLTPEEVESFHQEEVRVYNLLKKIDKAKETIIKYMEVTIQKKVE